MLLLCDLASGALAFALSAANQGGVRRILRRFPLPCSSQLVFCSSASCPASLDRRRRATRFHATAAGVRCRQTSATYLIRYRLASPAIKATDRAQKLAARACGDAFCCWRSLCFFLGVPGSQARARATSAACRPRGPAASALCWRCWRRERCGEAPALRPCRSHWYRWRHCRCAGR